MSKLFTYNVFSLVFSTSIEFSSPLNLGLDAFCFNYPKDAEFGNEIISVNFVLFSTEAIQNMAMSDLELLNYSKSTFLGTSKPAVAFKERNILEQLSVGEVLNTKIPVASNIEVHLITLSNNSKLCLGFKTKVETAVIDVENLVVEICNSLKMS